MPRYSSQHLLPGTPETGEDDFAEVEGVVQRTIQRALSEYQSRDQALEALAESMHAELISAECELNRLAADADPETSSLVPSERKAAKDQLPEAQLRVKNAKDAWDIARGDFLDLEQPQGRSADAESGRSTDKNAHLFPLRVQRDTGIWLERVATAANKLFKELKRTPSSREVYERVKDTGRAEKPGSPLNMRGQELDFQTCTDKYQGLLRTARKAKERHYYSGPIF